jgi:hypothetical protein
MTFAEFEKLPDEVCRRHELRHGELVEAPTRIHKYIRLQYQIRELLQARAPKRDIVIEEMPFRLLPDYEYYIVSTPDGVTTTYRAGQAIPLPLFGGGALPVDDIFNGLE